jgi:hypothetical protein
MQPIPPFWFKQRQGKLEPAGENTFKAAAPQQGEAFLSVRQDDKGQWSAAVRLTADGQDVESSAAEFPTPMLAWEAAFELYRRHVIV